MVALAGIALLVGGDNQLAGSALRFGGDNQLALSGAAGVPQQGGALLQGGVLQGGGALLQGGGELLQGGGLLQQAAARPVALSLFSAACFAAHTVWEG